MVGLTKTLAVLAAFVTKFKIVHGISESVGGKLCKTIDTDRVLVAEFATSEDATIFGNQPNIAAGRDKFIVGNTPNGIRRALLKFDVEIPAADAKVACAEIRLFTFTGSEKRKTPKIRAYEVTNNWVTTGGTTLSGVNGGLAEEGDCTWKYSKYRDTEWENPGGDFNPEKVLSEENPEDNLHWFGSTRYMNAAVQGWLDGYQPNNGFIFIADESNNEPAYSTYHGFENEPEFVPRLIVTYTSPSMGIPHLQDDELAKVFINPPVWKNSRSNKSQLSLAVILMSVIAPVLIIAIAIIVWYTNRVSRKEEAAFRRSQEVDDELVNQEVEDDELVTSQDNAIL